MEMKGAGFFAGSDDETLVFHIREGNTDALQELAVRYMVVAKQVARRHLRGSQDWGVLLAESIDQCVVKGKFDRNIGPLRPYLVETMRNQARSMRRSERTYRDRNSSYEQWLARGVPLDAIGSSVVADELVLAEHLCTIDAVIAAWENAPTRRRQKRRWALILRRVVEGRRVEDIASELGTDTKSIHNALVKHIRPQIRQALSSDAGGNTSAQR